MEHVTFNFEGLSVYQKALGFFIVFVVLVLDTLAFGFGLNQALELTA